MFCSKCGSPSPDGARFCASCGQAHVVAPPPANTQVGTPGINPPAYSPAPPPAPQQYAAGVAPAPVGQQPPVYYANPQQPPPAQPQPAYYPNPQPQAGQPVAQQPVYYQNPGQGWAPGSQGVKPYAVGKSPGLAVFLSFLIPGVGQFYCGANSKGAIMLAIYLVSWLLLGVFVGFFGIVGVWIWSMIDAYNVASGKTPLS